MNIRDILLVILYISLENVYGKSLKFVVHSDAELTSKHHIHESNRHLRLRRTNEKLSKHKNEKNIHSEDVVDHFDNSLEFSVAGNENEKVNNAHVKTISRRDDSAGDDCTNDNCSIVFENAGDDGENLMEEEKEEEEEEAEHLSSSKKETAHKTKKISHKDDGSGNNELVEQDRHIGTENSQHNRQSHKNNKGESSSATTEKENAGIKTKDKQVVLMPQSSVQEGTKSQVSNISDVAKYPSLPIPQMIPLPLFYNSGESEGSAANHLTSMAKNTKEVEDFNGESGYGELPIHKEHTQSAKTVLLNGENEAGKSLKGHAQKTPAGKHVKGVKDDKNSTKSKPIPTRLLTESIDFHSGAGKSVKAKGKKILTDKTNHHEKAPIVEVDRNIGDITENRAVINNGETTTDYPFVVSAGPKANIHVNGNSKIKIGNDHDEDLVDDYDDDDGEGEKGGSRRHKKVSSKVETGSGENKDFTSGESSNANSIPIQDMEGNGVSDFKEEKAEDEADDDEPVENQEPVKSTESSGSGSGEVATEYSGEAGKQNDQTAQLNSSASFQPSSNANGQNAQPSDMRHTYMLPLTDKQCDTLQQYANEDSKEIKEANFQKNSVQTDDSPQRSESTNNQNPLTNGDYILSQTDPGDIDTFRKMVVKLAQECYATKIKEIEEQNNLIEGKLLDVIKDKNKKVKTRKYKILKIPEGSKQLINLPNLRKLNQSFASLQLLPVIGPIQQDFFSPTKLDSEKRHAKQGQHSVGALEHEHDYSGDEEQKEHGGIRKKYEEKKKFVEVEFPDYTKIDLNALKRGGSTKSVKQKKGKTVNKIKTTAFEFDKGELGDNNSPVVVPAIRNTTSTAPAEVKGTDNKEIKEEWIVKNVKVNKDIKSILSDFNGVQPTYTATAGAPQALPVPQQIYQQQTGELVNRASPNVAAPSSQQQGTQMQQVATPSSQQQGAQMQHVAPPASQQQGTQMQHMDAPSSQKQGAQMQQQPQPQQRLIPNGANNFLKQGVSSRLINSLSSPHASTAVVQPLTSTSAQPNLEQRPCQSSCQTSCTSDCDPNCCRSSFSPAQGADPGTLTAEILPIPDNLNKALEDAGIGPGATAQILPTKENLKILKDAGYGAGVTAQVVPIPTDVEVVGNPMNVNSRSGAKPPQMIATFPQLSKLLSTNKQTPNVAVTQPAQTLNPPAAQPVVSYQQQNNNANIGIVNNQQLANVPSAAANPNVQSAGQQSFPQQPSTTYKDPTYLDPTSRSDSPANPAEQQAPPPAEVQKLETGPKVEQLPPGQTNYDQDSYKQILAELPPSVAPDQPIASSVPMHKPQQLTVNRFFSDRTKHQDPLQNLQAYKRQQFKDLDMAEDR